ncbi:MAG: hypothetical protein ACFFEE_02365 [Candidatus Thorarchaeota archaeon]
MKEITIKYWGYMGRQEERKFQCDDRKIDMKMRAAQRVDLSEVSRCTDIEVLNLGTNMLEEIDLAPLAGSRTISRLNLENNHLTFLDLWPLSDCDSLTYLNLKDNRLSGLDLTPLFLRAHMELDSSVVISADYTLRYLLTSEQLKERFLLARPDKAPWTATPVIIWNTYEALAETMGWADILKRIQTVLSQVPESDWYATQRGLMIALSIDELAGYDGDPNTLLDWTSDEMDFSTARQKIIDRAIDLLDEQIETGGSTLFLNTEAMKESRASKLIPKIVEARKQEMENIVVLTKGSTALMNSLWLSYYGFKILEALNIRSSRHYGDDLIGIKESFDELGFELKTKEVSSLSSRYILDPIRASDSLKKFMCNLVEQVYTN